MKTEKQNLNEVRQVVRKLIREEYILNDIIQEGAFQDIMTKIKDYGKKGLLTATILAGLANSPAFAKLSPGEKDQIKKSHEWVDVTDKSKTGKEWSGNVYNVMQTKTSQAEKGGKYTGGQTTTAYGKQQSSGPEKETSQSLTYQKKNFDNQKTKLRSYNYFDSETGGKQLAVQKDGKHKVFKGDKAERKFGKAVKKYGGDISGDIPGNQ